MDMFTLLSHEDVIFPSIFCYLSVEDIFRMRGVTKNWKLFVMDYFKSRHTLQIVNMKITNHVHQTAFKLVTRNNRNFKSLLLYDMWLPAKLIIPVINRCNNLSVVDLSYCSHLSNGLVVALARNCKSLRELSLHYCYWVKEDSFKLLMMNNPNLIKLNIAGCQQLDEESIKVVGDFCIHLQELDISLLYNPPDSALYLVANIFPYLTKLQVDSCFAITDAGIRAVVTSCKKLQSLGIEWYPNRGVTKEYLTQLEAQGLNICYINSIKQPKTKNWRIF